MTNANEPNAGAGAQPEDAQSAPAAKAAPEGKPAHAPKEHHGPQGQDRHQHGGKEAKGAPREAKEAKEGKEGKEKKSEPKAPWTPRLKDLYNRELRTKLMTELGLKNSLAVPRLQKICLNMGVGKALENKNILVEAVKDLTAIAGQKAVLVKARKSVSNFKLRAGYDIACRVTLRGAMMWDFLDRFINIAMPQIRDFRGCSPRSFDGSGNYSMGIAERSIFPEIAADRVQFPLGMDITVVTSAQNNDHARALLAALGVPFRK
ncbi:MAG: 50S ribosomal protein L5 [Planctomycetota bacterium]